MTELSSDEGSLAFLAGPGDSFGLHFQQFAALDRLDYPAELRKIPSDEVIDYVSATKGAGDQEGKELERIMQRSRSYIAEKGGEDNPFGWYQPILKNPDFHYWIADPHHMLDQCADDMLLRTYRQLRNHPGDLIPTYISDGAFRPIAAHIDRASHRPKASSPAVYIRMLQAAYMRAFDRHEGAPVTVRPAGNFEPATDHAPWATTADRNRYNSYQAHGIKPISVRAVGALVRKFYIDLEEHVPEFAAFKADKR